MKQYIVTVKNADGVERKIKIDDAPNRFQAEQIAMHEAYVNYGAGWQPVRVKEVIEQ